MKDQVERMFSELDQAWVVEKIYHSSEGEVSRIMFSGVYAEEFSMAIYNLLLPRPPECA